MLLHDAAHSGYVLSPAPDTNHTLASKIFKSAITTSAAAANAMIYVVAGETLYALNSSTLFPFWSTSLGNPCYSSPASSGGKIYVGVSNGTILAINAQNGQIVWGINTKTPTYSSPVIQGGRLFIALYDGTLLAVDLATHHVLWRFNAGANIVASPAANGLLVAVGSKDGVMHFVNEANGTPYWSVTTGAGISSSVSFSSNMAYFGSNDSKVYAADTERKTVAWQFTANGPVLSTPIPFNDQVYAASLGGSVFAIDNLTGMMTWKFDSGPVAVDVALAEGVHKNLTPTHVPMLYAVNTTGTLFGINYTGVSVWSLRLNGTSGGSPIVAYTKIYVGVTSGYLAEIGALRFATAVASFTTDGSFSTHFGADSTVRLAANAAWGKYGLNRTLVSVTLGKNTIILVDATMKFVTGNVNYNLYYDLALSGAKTGTYHVKVALEDAHPKYNSTNQRCCGWVNFTTFAFYVP